MEWESDSLHAHCLHYLLKGFPYNEERTLAGSINFYIIMYTLWNGESYSIHNMGMGLLYHTHSYMRTCTHTHTCSVSCICTCVYVCVCVCVCACEQMILITETYENAVNWRLSHKLHDVTHTSFRSLHTHTHTHTHTLITTTYPDIGYTFGIRFLAHSKPSFLRHIYTVHVLVVWYYNKPMETLGTLPYRCAHIHVHVRSWNSCEWKH